MGLFGKQLANVVEWANPSPNMIFWKWSNNEIKKGSKLIIRQAQEAIFMFNGKIEGVFKDAGDFDIESEIIPFLSTLKGFKFGFNSGMRAEVLFINTKQLTVKWGTRNPVKIPMEGLKYGIDIRAFGGIQIAVDDELTLINQIAGIKSSFTVEEVKERVLEQLDALLMVHIPVICKDNATPQQKIMEIARAIQPELDMELLKIGLKVVKFTIQSFTYNEEMNAAISKVATHDTVQDMAKYQAVEMTNAMANGKMSRGTGTATDMMGLQMGMMMGQQMMQNMQNTQNQQNMQASQGLVSGNQGNSSGGVNFCPNCGTKASAANFCGNCGTKLN